MFLKRAGWSLWRHKFRNILILLVFSAILAVTLTCFMVYAGTSYQVEVTQKAVANAVTLSGPTINGRLGSLTMGVDFSDATRFVLGPHVERHNIVMENIGLESRDLIPGGTEEEVALFKKYRALLDSYEDEYLDTMQNWVTWAFQFSGYRDGYNYKAGQTDDGALVYEISNPEYTPEENAQFLEDYNLLYSGQIDGQPIPDALRVTAVSDSEYFDAFSQSGYSLVEGRHFKTGEEHESYALISRATAEASGVKVGDKFKLNFSGSIASFATFYKNDPWEVSIIGLFDPPQNDILADIDYRVAAENTIFVPYEAVFDYLDFLYNGESLLWIPNTTRATVYVDAPENVEEFIEFAYDSFRLIETDPETGIPVGTSIEDVLSEGTFGTDDPDVIDAKFMEFMKGQSGQSPAYNLSVDRQWYDMVAMPMENLNVLSLFMGIALLAGAFVALLLVCIFNVRSRKREVGVLLSMGESKGKVFLQMFLEQALPLVLAAVIGFGAGVPLASRLGNGLLESRAGQVNAAYEQDKREYLSAQLAGNPMSLDNSMTMRSAANVASPVQMQFTLDTRLAWGYFGLAFGMLFLTVLIQMILLLRLSPAKIMTRRN